MASESIKQQIVGAQIVGCLRVEDRPRRTNASIKQLCHNSCVIDRRTGRTQHAGFILGRIGQPCKKLPSRPTRLATRAGRVNHNRCGRGLQPNPLHKDHMPSFVHRNGPRGSGRAWARLPRHRAAQAGKSRVGVGLHSANVKVADSPRPEGEHVRCRPWGAPEMLHPTRSKGDQLAAPNTQPERVRYWS